MVTQAKQHATNRRYSSAQNTSQKWLFFVGDCPNMTAYLAQRRYLSSWGPIKFTDALLRGYGQVVYANNPVSGALVLLALTIADIHFSLAGLITSSAGLLSSLVLIPQNAGDIQQGLTVYNPLLIGLITSSALPERYHIELQFWHWFLMLFAAVLSVYVTSAFSNILGSLTRFPLPCFTLPFNVVQPVLFLCIVSLTNFQGSTSSPLIEKQFISSTPLLQNNGSFHHSSPEKLTEISPQEFLLGGFLNFSGVRHPPRMSDTSISTEVTIAYSGTEAPKTLQGHLKLSTPAFSLVQRMFDMSRTQKSSKMEDATAKLPTAVPGVAMGYQMELAMDTESSLNLYDTVTTAAVSKSGMPRPPKGDGTEALNRTSTYAEPKQNWKTESDKEFNNSNDSYATMNISNVISVDLTETYGKENTHNSDDAITRRTDWGEVFSGVVLSMARVYGSNYPQGAILIYTAVLLCSPILAAFGVIGAVTGTLTGLLLTDPATYATTNGVYEGGWGSNGLLCAMAVGGYYFVLTWQAAVTAVFSAIFATALQFVLVPAFASGNLYPMSLPFNLSALLLLSASSPGAITRPVKFSTPEKHRLEHRRHLHKKVHNMEEITQEMVEDGKATRE